MDADVVEGGGDVVIIAGLVLDALLDEFESSTVEVSIIVEVEIVTEILDV